MSEYIESTTVHNGYTVKIIADTDVQAPDDEMDNGLFIVTTRNRHFQVLHEDMDARQCVDDPDLSKTYWRFPLFAYVHSGVALSLSNQGYPFNDQWDSAQIGFVFAAKSEWRYRLRDLKKCASAFEAASGLVETWNQYLSGDVWGYVISDADGNQVDSCWGFYGLEYCKSEALACVPAEVSCPSDALELEVTLP